MHFCHVAVTWQETKVYRETRYINLNIRWTREDIFYVVEINKGSLIQMKFTGFHFIYEGSGHLKRALFASQSKADMTLIRTLSTVRLAMTCG